MHSEGLDISGNYAAMGITQADFDMNDDDDEYDHHLQEPHLQDLQLLSNGANKITA